MERGSRKVKEGRNHAEQEWQRKKGRKDIRGEEKGKREEKVKEGRNSAEEKE